LSARARTTESTQAARWSAVALLAAALFINYVDRGAVPTAAHLIQDDLRLTPAQLGVLFSAFFWSYALLQLPAGYLAERFGAWRILAGGLTLWAGATLLTGTVRSFTALLALRLLLGVGESAGFPSVSKLLATVVPLKDLGRANGLVGFAYLFGPAVGAYGGGLLMAQFGWRAAFWVFGGMSLLWLLPWFYLRERQPERAARAAPWPPLCLLLRQVPLWGTSLGHFSSNYAFYFILTWLPYYLVRERGFSLPVMAEVTGSAYVVNALAALATGWLLDGFARGGRATFGYKSIMVAAQLGAVVCMPCIALGTHREAITALFVYQVLIGMASPGTFAIPQILAGPTAAGRWVGVQNSIANLSGILAPALTGLLVSRTGHFTAAFLLAAAVSVLGLIGWVAMIPEIRPLPWPARQATAGEGTALSTP
jgi:MFS family permease